jgi:hypothetical protein
LPPNEKDHELHFVLKVAAEDNTWTPGYSHTRLSVPPRLDKSHGINVVEGVYLRPGRYTLALIVYDSVTQKGNVQRKKIKVPRPKGDVLPEMDRTLSDVEFTTEVPLKNKSINFPRYANELSYQPLAAGREWLPVRNSRRICLDIVANISPGRRYTRTVKRGRITSNILTYPDIKEYGRHYAEDYRVLQAAGVLSHLGLENGKIHVSILNTLGVKTYFYRENAVKLDWRRTGQALLNQSEPDTVDYGQLKAETEASAYLVDTLHKIMDENSCTPDSEPPLKIILVVSGDLKFAERTPIRRLIPPDRLKYPFPNKVFHFRIGRSDGSYDDLRTMLEPLKPQKYSFMDARSFRQALADFISRLEEL